MKRIILNEMIITCESCGNVKRYRVQSQEECDRLFREFQCENNCGRNLYSFITLGSLQRNFETPNMYLRLASASH